MKLLVNQNNKVVIAIATTAEHVKNGIHVDKGLFDENGFSKEAIYADIDNSISVLDVDIPSNIEPTKYCYDEFEGFYENPNYQPYVPVEEQVELLKQENEQLKKSQADQDAIIMSLVLGGM